MTKRQKLEERLAELEWKRKPPEQLKEFADRFYSEDDFWNFFKYFNCSDYTDARAFDLLIRSCFGVGVTNE